MTRGKGSIRSRMLLFMLLNSLLPMLVIGVLGYVYSLQTFDRLQRDKMSELLSADSREISAHLRLFLRPIRFLSEMPASAFKYDDEISFAYQKSLIRFYTDFTSIAILTPGGFPFWIKGDKDVFPATGLRIPQKIVDTGEGVTLFYREDSGPFSVPYPVLLSQRNDGNFACGVLSQDFFRDILSSLSFGNEGKVLLFDNVGKLVTPGEKQNPLVERIGQEIKNNFSISKKNRFSMIARMPDPYGMSLVCGQMLYGDGINLPEWILVAVQRYDSSLGPMDNLRWYGLLLGVLSCAITIFIAWRLSLEISTPLNELSHLAHQVALGNLNVACRPSGWREINSLGGSFNHMLQRLRKNKDIRASFKHEIRLRNRFEAKLKKARSAAEIASRSKSEFLSNVSHEIRTPLNAIMGYAEKLLVENYDKTIRHDLTTVLNESKNLLLLINDLLDHAKIEAGKLDLEYVAFDLHRLLRDITESFRIQASDKGLEFNLEIMPQVPQYVMHDPLRLRQVLSNLLSNAIKFTREGKVGLQVEAFTNDGRYAQTRFSVHDTGIGIPEDKQKDIFEAFSQVDSSYTRKYGGTGLGTAISSRLVTLMGGHMGLNSRSGEGSTFMFDLLIDVNVSPVDIEALQSDSSSQPKMFKGEFSGNVLVAEDYEVNQELLRSQLSFLGMDVSVADNGRIALDMCHEDKYDIIFMDLQMPEMDGVLATERILRDCPLNQQTPVVALTANADSLVRRACKDAGMREVINKPTRVEELAGALDRWLSDAGRKEAARHVEEVLSTNYSVDGENTQQADAYSGEGGNGEHAADMDGQAAADGPVPVDLEEASRLFAGNDMVLRMSLQQFINSVAGELIPQLTQALAEGDLAVVSRRAHKIKGGAASICAGEVKRTAGEIEAYAKEGNDEECRRILPELVKSFGAARQYIESAC